MHISTFSLFATLSAITSAASLSSRAVLGTVSVDLSSNTGSTQHYASGFICGIPPKAGQIPDKFYTEIGLQYARFGGGQVAAPGRGWIYGMTEYNNRFAAVKSVYQTARKYNAKFILEPSDLWGADATQAKGSPMPGDNGDWSQWDTFLTHVIADLKANNMLGGLQIDIWNEPDISSFWGKGTAQWLALWGRAYHRLRTELPTALLLGPTLSHQPVESQAWWTRYLDFIKSNASIPDQYVWHLESNPKGNVDDDLATNTPVFNAMLSARGLPKRQINIDEYAVFTEQVPSGAAWWIARLERYNAWGLRGNWLMGWQLNDFMGSLLGKADVNSQTGTGYYGNGEWQVYRYYNLNMTGHRVATTGSTDRLVDVYATLTTENKAKFLVGPRQVTGNYQLTVNKLTSLGLPAAGTIRVQTWGFPDMGHFGRLDKPVDLGINSHTYTGGSITWPLPLTQSGTAYAFEIL